MIFSFDYLINARLGFARAFAMVVGGIPPSEDFPHHNFALDSIRQDLTRLHESMEI
jgi:hypothetical protein